jgi:two-component system sensor histidine kinase ChvG
MALRRQLLLMAGLTLVLPWAGREYVREMEVRVREGQQGALLATAQAVAARIGADTVLLAQLREQLNGNADAYYAHPLPAPVVVDGYGEEWRAFGFVEQMLSGAPHAGVSQSSVTWGRRDGVLYGLVRVADAERRYFDPSEPVISADHLLLRLGSEVMRIYTAAPGSVTVERLTLEGSWVREHSVSGVWNEEEVAYGVELRIPLAWGQQGVGVAVNGLSSDSELVPRPLVVPDTALDELLRVFARPGVRLSLASGGWIVGQGGYLQQDLGTTEPGPARWLVRLMLGRLQLPILDSGRGSGRLIGGEMQQAQAGQSGEAWYLLGDTQVGRVTVPAVPSDLVVVAEQSMDATDTLVSGAFGRLLLYSLLASGFVATVLLSYASVLSWRIRRLSRAAQQAVDADGRIHGLVSSNQFPSSRSRDEIGDLARTYQALLQRLHDYTQYLESLAGKLSHELRTPLAIVRGSLDNLAQVTEPDEQKVYIDRASEGLQRLSNILNAMSAASRLEHILHQYDFEQLDLRPFFDDLVRMYQDLCRPCRVALRWESEGPWVLSVAPELLAQMCDKLLENAADFSGPEGEIELALARLDKWVRLQVINTGPPLPEILQERIFDSLTGTRAGEGQHLGLGLYVVRLIVQYHQGQVRAFNHPAGGRVVFEILLPV